MGWGLLFLLRVFGRVVRRDVESEPTDHGAS